MLDLGLISEVSKEEDAETRRDLRTVDAMSPPSPLGSAEGIASVATANVQDSDQRAL